jgi:PadR family transcriptional regulator PadR
VTPRAAATEDVRWGLPRNLLRPLLLLLLAEGTGHGYELLQQVRRLGLDKVDPGGVYRSLRAMDEEGLVHSRWEPSTAGPSRRNYELTDEGREYLHALAGAVMDSSRVLNDFTRRYEQLARREHG